jgi:hypothetical protein
MGRNLAILRVDSVVCCAQEPTSRLSQLSESRIQMKDAPQQLHRRGQPHENQADHPNSSFCKHFHCAIFSNHVLILPPGPVFPHVSFRLVTLRSLPRQFAKSCSGPFRLFQLSWFSPLVNLIAALLFDNADSSVAGCVESHCRRSWQHYHAA